MPRTARLVLPGVPHHITQRGNYRQKTYFRAEDYQMYLDLLLDYSRHHGVSILGYCLMPNHVHLIAVPHKGDSLARTLRRVHADYARAVHTRLRRVGHLWQARYHSAPMDEEHFWAAMLYVEQNPVRAALVGHCADWKWSSAQAHTTGSVSPLLDLVGWRQRYTPEAWKRVLELGLEGAALFERIRDATLAGRPMGSEAFLERVEREFHVNARANRPGRRPKAGTAASSAAYSQLTLPGISG